MSVAFTSTVNTMGVRHLSGLRARSFNARRPTMHGYTVLGALGDDGSDLIDSGTYESYSNDLIPPSDSSLSQSLVLLPGSAYPTAAELTPSYDSYSNTLVSPPTTTVATPAGNPIAAAVSSIGQVASTAMKAVLAPGSTATVGLTPTQIAAANAANPLNQLVPGTNMNLGSLLLIGGVVIAAGLLISRIRR
jgi:hypothetical protein